MSLGREFMSLSVRKLIHFSGRVQGVGFRYTTSRIAHGYSVTGFVRNMADGRVELTVEGSAAEVRSFLDELQTTMAGNIEFADVHDLEATGEFASFEIRF